MHLWLMAWHVFDKLKQLKWPIVMFAFSSSHLLLPKAAKRIDVVFDVYVDNSIKDVERSRLIKRWTEA